MIKHFQQEKNTSCGAAAYRMLLSDNVDMTEKEARKECKTKASGTYTFNVISALKQRGIEFANVNLDVDFEEYSRWLFLNSMGRKLYLSCHYRDKAYGGKGGRDGQRHHAIVASEGYIYDPSEAKPCPIEAYFDVYSKKLTIKEMILIDVR